MTLSPSPSVFHISKSRQMIGVPMRADLMNLFPHARHVTFQGNETMVLPHGFAETKVLRNLGLNVPAPIMEHYDWAGGKPFEVQRQTAAMLTTNNRGYVLNGMGTGKTKSAIWAFDFLRSQGLAKRMLVVAPLSTLNFTWAREVFATAPHLSATVLHGDKARRLKRLEEEHDVYVINPDGVAVIADALAARGDIDVLCLDELAVYRNGQSKRNKTMRKIAATRTWVWGMTGSPTPNDPTDAWGQCAIVTPNTVPKYFGRFRDECMSKVTAFKYAVKDDANERVMQVMQPAVRFSLDDVVELPDLIERTIDIELGPKQKEIYDKLRQHAYAAVQTQEITASNAGAVLSKLLQVSLGFVYSKDAAGERKVVTLDNDARMTALLDAIESTSRKVIVFASFEHALHGINERLAKEGIETATIHGGVSKSARDDIFAAFQGTNKYKCIVAHPQTMSHGLTLTAADTIIWYGPTTSLETFEQANARIRRIGQKSKQQVLMFQGTAAEKRMYARLRTKQKVQADLLSMFAEAQT